MFELDLVVFKDLWFDMSCNYNLFVFHCHGAFPEAYRHLPERCSAFPRAQHISYNPSWTSFKSNNVWIFPSYLSSTFYSSTSSTTIENSFPTYAEPKRHARRCCPSSGSCSCVSGSWLRRCVFFCTGSLQTVVKYGKIPLLILMVI